MIVELENTTVSRVSKKLVQLREQGGAVALGRVLTLVIQTDHKGLEAAIKSANEASREHPCRILVLAEDGSSASTPAKLDAEIRVGGDAGASEVIVLKAPPIRNGKPGSIGDRRKLVPISKPFFSKLKPKTLTF